MSGRSMKPRRASARQKLSSMRSRFSFSSGSVHGTERTVQCHRQHVFMQRLVLAHVKSQGQRRLILDAGEEYGRAGHARDLAPMQLFEERRERRQLRFDAALEPQPRRGARSTSRHRPAKPAAAGPSRPA